MKRILLGITLIAVAAPVQAQMDEMSDEEQVRAVIDRMFEGMNQADSAMLRSVFDSNTVVRRPTRNQQGELVLGEGNIDDFVTQIGQMEAGFLEEPIWDVEIQIDDRLAQVWAKYELIAGGEFHHCGVDAFQLWKSEDGWKIFVISDTARTEDCWHAPQDEMM